MMHLYNVHNQGAGAINAIKWLAAASYEVCHICIILLVCKWRLIGEFTTQLQVGLVVVFKSQPCI